MYVEMDPGGGSVCGCRGEGMDGVGGIVRCEYRARRKCVEVENTYVRGSVRVGMWG